MSIFPPAEPNPRAQLAADTLAKMANLVTANSGNGFAGVFVIAAPGEGEIHTTLLLDPSENVAAFWSLVQTKATMALAELEEKERNSNMFGRPR